MFANWLPAYRCVDSLCGTTCAHLFVVGYLIFWLIVVGRWWFEIGDWLLVVGCL